MRAGLALNPATPLAAAGGSRGRSRPGARDVGEPGLRRAVVPAGRHRQDPPRPRPARPPPAPRAALEVDGGITTETIAEAWGAGADTFVAGTAVFGAPDPGRGGARPAAALRRERLRNPCRNSGSWWARHRRRARPGRGGIMTQVGSEVTPVEVGARGPGLQGDRPRHRRLGLAPRALPRQGDPDEHLGHLVRALPRRDAGHAAALRLARAARVRIAAVSIDEGSPEDVRDFGQELGSHLRPPAGPQRAGSQQLYQTTGVPESFLLDRRRHDRQAGHRRPRLELPGEPRARRAPARRPD